MRPATRTPRVLTVGALKDDGTKADFSNYGSSVNLWAPGVDIPVPVPTSLNGQKVSGTSFSAPLAAGVAAMMRAVNNNWSVDQIRNTLVSSGWNGSGAVTKGLDAYAAVWQAMAARMAENSLEKPTERLYPHADGTFEPIFNDAINSSGDVDAFLFDVSSYSAVEVDLQWYDRLADIVLGLDNVDPDTATPNFTVTGSPGQARLVARLGSGTYRLRLRGTAPTAYLLTGRISLGRLEPDRFEHNDSFDTATSLLVVPHVPLRRTLFEYGPGEFALTLHTAAAPPVTTDQDYFRIDVPGKLPPFTSAQIFITSDEPVDISLFDAARSQTATWTGVKFRIVTLPIGRRSYLRVAGSTHTRYSLWVGTAVTQPVPKQWKQGLRVIPDWWMAVLGEPEWMIRPEEFRAVILGEEAIADGVLTFGGATGTLPAGVRMELLHASGKHARRAELNAGNASFDLSGLGTGAYILRITSHATSARPVGIVAAAPPAPQSQRATCTD